MCRKMNSHSKLKYHCIDGISKVFFYIFTLTFVLSNVQIHADHSSSVMRSSEFQPVAPVGKFMSYLNISCLM